VPNKKSLLPTRMLRDDCDVCELSLIVSFFDTFHINYIPNCCLVFIDCLSYMMSLCPSSNMTCNCTYSMTSIMSKYLCCTCAKYIAHVQMRLHLCKIQIWLMESSIWTAIMTTILISITYIAELDEDVVIELYLIIIGDDNY
jgi:hypothetical protein